MITENKRRRRTKEALRQVRFNMTETEKKELDELVEESGLSLSQYLRDLVKKEYSSITIY